MKLYNFPKFKHQDDYYHVVKNKLEQLSLLPWVQEVYQIGSVGCPGISDIDLVVVTDDRGFNGHGQSLINTKDSYFFIHDGLWLRQRDLDQLTKLFCTDRLNFPMTNEGNRTARNYTLNDEEKLIYLLEICFNKLIQHNGAPSENIDARKLLTRASSIIHSVDLAKQLEIPNIDLSQKYADEMKKIRSSWLHSEGTVSINYEEIYDGLSMSLLNLLHNSLEEKSHMFNATATPTISLILGAKLKSVIRCFQHQRPEADVISPELITKYFSGYDAEPVNALQANQSLRKRAIQSHFKYLKRNRLTYSLRSIPAIPFDSVSRLTRTALYSMKSLSLRKN